MIWRTSWKYERLERVVVNSKWYWSEWSNHVQAYHTHDVYARFKSNHQQVICTITHHLARGTRKAELHRRMIIICQISRADCTHKRENVEDHDHQNPHKSLNRMQFNTSHWNCRFKHTYQMVNSHPQGTTTCAAKAQNADQRHDRYEAIKNQPVDVVHSVWQVTRESTSACWRVPCSMRSLYHAHVSIMPP